MADETSVIFDNREGHEAKLAILCPVRNDQRLFRLLDHLKSQARDEVHVWILNDLQPDPFITELPAPLRGVILYHARPCTIATKMNLLLDKAEGEWRAVIESDTIPDERWLADVLRIAENGERNAVHVGGEMFEKGLSLNNILFPADLDLPRFQENLHYAQDTGWFMACEHKGYSVVRHNREALLFHDVLGKKYLRHYMRFIYYSYDFAFLAAKYGGGAFLKRRLLAEGFYLFRGLLNLPLTLVFYVWFALKKAVGRL